MHMFTLHLRLARYPPTPPLPSGKAVQQLQCTARAHTNPFSAITWALCSNQCIREGETDAAGSTQRVRQIKHVRSVVVVVLMRKGDQNNNGVKGKQWAAAGLSEMNQSCACMFSYCCICHLIHRT